MVLLNSNLTFAGLQLTTALQVSRVGLPYLVSCFGVHDSVSLLRANHQLATLI